MDDLQSSIEEQNRSLHHQSSELPSQWLNRMNSEGKVSRGDSFFQSISRYYIPHTRQLSTVHRHRNFGRLLSYEDDQTPKFQVHDDELKRFSLVQVKYHSILRSFTSIISRLIMLQNYSIPMMDIHHIEAIQQLFK